MLNWTWNWTAILILWKKKQFLLITKSRLFSVKPINVPLPDLWTSPLPLFYKPPIIREPKVVSPNARKYRLGKKINSKAFHTAGVTAHSYFEKQHKITQGKVFWKCLTHNCAKMYSISKRSFGISREITFSHESSIFLKHPLTNLHKSAFYKLDFVAALLFVKIFIFVFVGAGYGESILILSIFTNYESILLFFSHMKFKTQRGEPDSDFYCDVFIKWRIRFYTDICTDEWKKKLMKGNFKLQFGKS